MFFEALGLFVLICLLQVVLVVKAGDFLTSVLDRTFDKADETIGHPKGVPAF